MSSREELLIMQQIKLMEEMQRKAREKEKRREDKKIRKQKVCRGFLYGEGTPGRAQSAGTGSGKFGFYCLAHVANR
jgi:hypothetical protein